MALLGSKRHTEGATTRWTVRYGKWLDNTATIDTIAVQSNSASCTIGPDVTINGPDIIFFLIGGQLNERLTVSLTMTDNFGNIKPDTIAFTVVAA